MCGDNVPHASIVYHLNNKWDVCYFPTTIKYSIVVVLIVDNKVLNASIINIVLGIIEHCPM